MLTGLDRPATQSVQGHRAQPPSSTTLIPHPLQPSLIPICQTTQQALDSLTGRSPGHARTVQDITQLLIGRFEGDLNKLDQSQHEIRMYKAKLEKLLADLSTSRTDGERSRRDLGEAKAEIERTMESLRVANVALRVSRKLVSNLQQNVDTDLIEISIERDEAVSRSLQECAARKLEHEERVKAFHAREATLREMSIVINDKNGTISEQNLRLEQGDERYNGLLAETESIKRDRDASVKEKDRANKKKFKLIKENGELSQETVDGAERLKEEKATAEKLVQGAEKQKIMAEGKASREARLRAQAEQREAEAGEENVRLKAEMAALRRRFGIEA